VQNGSSQVVCVRMIVINLRTCKDWGKPGDVKIDRTTKWGNPFKLTTLVNREGSIKLYEWWVSQMICQGKLNLSDFDNAKRLGCWCKPLACHGDVLKKLIEDYGITRKDTH